MSHEKRRAIVMTTSIIGDGLVMSRGDRVRSSVGGAPGAVPSGRYNGRVAWMVGWSTLDRVCLAAAQPGDTHAARGGSIAYGDASMAEPSPTDIAHASSVGSKRSWVASSSSTKRSAVPSRPTSGTSVHRLPGAVARCANAEQVSEVARYCREHGIPVTARVRGTRRSENRPPRGCSSIHRR